MKQTYCATCGDAPEQELELAPLIDWMFDHAILCAGQDASVETVKHWQFYNVRIEMRDGEDHV